MFVSLYKKNPELTKRVYNKSYDHIIICIRESFVLMYLSAMSIQIKMDANALYAIYAAIY